MRHMRRRVLAAALTLLIPAGLTAARAQTPPQPTCNSAQPPQGLSFPTVSSMLPFDATFPKNLNNLTPQQFVDVLQQGFDIFSWASFVALNWPSNPDGTPMSGPITSNPTAPRVWEAYIDATGVFKSQGAPPDPWGGTNTFLASIVSKHKPGQKVLFASSKNVLGEISQAGFGIGNANAFPGIADLNNKYVFYEVHLNKPEYDYIVCPDRDEPQPPCKNNLYSQDGQTAFLKSGGTISLPQGSNSPQSYGAIEVKAAWKQLGAGDDPTKFYTVVATLIDPVTGEEIPDVNMGLVGLHIITWTSSASPAAGSPSQAVWSTFEHVANAPDAPLSDAQPPPPPAGSHFNFNDPTQKQPASGFGYQPSSITPVASPKPTQITRVVKNACINGAWTQTLNSKMQAALAGTVWANYRLVTTQWPFALNTFLPSSVTNTTMETYVQTFADCMDCHTIAPTAGTDSNGNTASANFSFLLPQAQATNAPPAVLRSRR
jgi:hypothetical protein